MGRGWVNTIKQAQAQKKGQLFTKLAKEIAVAARLGGPDPDGNARLKLAIQVAREASCPRDTIERAIKKGSGQLADESQIEEYTYEGMAPHNVGVIIECHTDNKNRTISDLRALFNKNGGRLGESGSVAWMFERVSLVSATRDSVKDPEEEAIEAGANEVTQEDDGSYTFLGAVSDLDAIRSKLIERGWKVSAAELAYHPKNTTDLGQSERQAVEEFLGLLQDSDDTHRVYATLS